MSYDPKNVFACILRNEIPCEKVYEDENFLAFNDVNKVAPVHVLLIPKLPYSSFDDFVQNAEPTIISDFFKLAQRLAQQCGLVESGYRLITNIGEDGMQTVLHFHLHIIGKTKLGALI